MKSRLVGWWCRGFSITYDVRMMRSPSMQMVTTVAEWGAAPVRQKRRTARICIMMFDGFAKDQV